MKAARAWAVAGAKDINAAGPTGAKEFPTTAPLTVPASVQKGYLNVFFDADVKRNLLYPGPLPFTPTAVQHNGSKATIDTCAWARGFARDRTTGGAPQKKRIEATQFLMERSASGVWLVENFVGHRDGNCTGVRVQGIEGLAG